VSQGGDTDTVGAVTGALAGARFGANASGPRTVTYEHRLGNAEEQKPANSFTS